MDSNNHRPIVSLLPDGDLHVGQRLTLKAAATDISVEIRCFVQEPNGGGTYKTCKECGKFAIAAGKSRALHVPTFDGSWSGYLHIYASAAEGEVVELKRTVLPLPEALAELDDTPDKKAFAFVDAQFANLMADLEETTSRLARRASVRRIGATTLTLLAIAGGLALAGGVTGWLTQAIGLSVAAAAALERAFSNHQRLLAETQARNALVDLWHRIAAQHTAAMPAIIVKKESANPKLRKQAVTELTDLVKELDAGARRRLAAVRKHLEKAEIEALQKLAVEYAIERHTAQKQLPGPSASSDDGDEGSR